MLFEISTTIDAPVSKVYEAWLDSRKHSTFTGMTASISPQEGKEFSTYGNYITGRNIKLVPNTKIIQSWRTTEFDRHQPDSIVEISLKEQNGQTRLSLSHSNLPADGMKYKQGWKDYYFEPMQEYFGKHYH
jgi:uncharacterized protein YndB with AHSA1/START domain